MNIFKKLFNHITPELIPIPVKEEPAKHLNDITQFDDV